MGFVTFSDQTRADIFMTKTATMSWQSYYGKARRMQLYVGLHEKLWPEGFLRFAYLTNWAPTRSLSWESPLTYILK